MGGISEGGKFPFLCYVHMLSILMLIMFSKMSNHVTSLLPLHREKKVPAAESDGKL